MDYYYTVSPIYSYLLHNVEPDVDYWITVSATAVQLVYTDAKDDQTDTDMISIAQAPTIRALIDGA